MFEEKTYEKIMQDKLNRVPSDVDKREGSVVYDALAPNAMETKEMYLELENYYKETFGSTASRKYLIERAKERGVYPKSASAGSFKGIFNIDVEIGARFSLEQYNYIVVEKLETGSHEYKLQCESVGSGPNATFGDLIPIEYIEGLTSAKLTEILIPGEDEEDTEKFRQRYIESFEPQAFGGNIKDYEEKTLSIAGVGAVKVTPVWKGGGTVRLTILDSTFSAATSELIKTVQAEIDPTQDGQGLGLAPIDHRVTVDTPEKITINITTKVELNDIEWGTLENDVKKIIEQYLLELRKNWAKENNITVRVAQIEAKILSIDGIVDIANTKINGKAENLILTAYQIPILGGVANE